MYACLYLMQRNAMQSNAMQCRMPNAMQFVCAMLVCTHICRYVYVMYVVYVGMHVCNVCNVCMYVWNIYIYIYMYTYDLRPLTNRVHRINSTEFL